MKAYVCSCGRCGSLSLQKWIDTFTPCIMEPMETVSVALLARGIKDGLNTVETGISDLTKTFSSKKVLIDWEHRSLHGVNDGVVSWCVSYRPPGATVVDHSISLLTGLLRKHHPQLKFIWLIRNAWDCVSSLMAWKWYRPPGYFKDGENYSQNRIEAWWVGDMTKEEWDDLPTLGKCAWWWSWANGEIERGLRDISGAQELIVPLERWNDRLACQVARFLDCDPPSDLKLPHTHRGFADEERPTWTKDERDLVWRFCRPLMLKYYPGWPKPEQKSVNLVTT